MQIVAVVAMSENRVIGRDGDLPWRISADLKHFKAVTMGYPILMGRKTWESLGRPLPGRRNIVITRNADFAVNGTERAASLDDALAMCAGAEKAMIIGGGQIYKEIMDRLDVIELTEVHAETDGDTYFPEIDPADWRETSRERFEPETLERA
jgi:dihydrofolate reductase